MNSIRLSWLTLSVAAALAACQGDSLAPTPTTSGDDDPAPSRIGPEEAVSRTADQLRFGFQASDDGLRAQADTHDAAVRGGDLVMVPHHYDGVRTIVGGPVRFATTEVTRGDVSLADAAPAARLADEGMVAIARGAVVETLENRDDGVEQSWHFAGAPDGDGDLLVAVAVSGHREVKTSRTGLHFLNGDQLGFSYSHAMWIDATRTAWNIPVSWQGDRIVMRVPASVLDRSSYPAVLDPVIGPEKAVDSPVAGFTGGAANQPALSRGSGANFLAVWTDDRNGNERESEIYAARIRSDGTPIDVAGIIVARSTILEHEPAVTWTGSEWLVAWTREDDSGAGVAAATVGADGSVTQLGTVANTSGHESQPALASIGGGNALLVYTWNLQIRALRYSAGAFQPSITISAVEEEEGFATVAASGTNYLVAWQLGDAPGQDIWGRIVNQTGSNPAAFPISEAPNTLTLPSATFNGTDFAVVWRRAGDIWGARVSTAGAVLDSTGAIGGIALSETGNVETDPAIACSTTQCLLTWADARDNSDPNSVAFDLVAQRRNFDLSPVGGVATVGDFLRNQDDPAVVSAQSGSFVVVYTDARSGVPSVFATRISAGGAVSSPNGQLVNTATRNAQNRPGYAVGTTNQLAVWSDSRVFGDDVMARRYSSTGARLDTGALTVSGAQWDQASPAISFDGSQFVVVWRDARNPTGDIFAARMQQDGTVSDPGGIAVSTADNAQIAPDVASGGGVSLVAWQDRRTPANGYDIMGAIIDADGNVSADFAICQEADEQTNAAIAWDPNSSLFVVAWTDRRTDGSADVYAARVEADGTVLDPCGVPISEEPTNWQQSPDIAVSGTQLLVVWEDYRNDFFGDIWGGRITTTGGGITRLDGDGVPIATGVSFQTTPTTVGVGLGRWGIAWTDTLDELTTGTDIRGNTMAPDGTLSIEPEYQLSAGVYYESAPEFQSGGGDSSSVVLMYEYDRPSTGTLRVRRRQITY